MSELAGESFIDFPEGWGFRSIVDAAFASAGVDRTVQTEVADFQTAIELVQGNFGLAFVPEPLAILEEQAVPYMPTSLSWKIQIARSADRGMTAAEESVIIALRDSVPALQ